MGDNTTKQSSNSTSTSTATPYPAIQPLLDSGFSDAASQYNFSKKAAPWNYMLAQGATQAHRTAANDAEGNPLAGVATQFQDTFGRDGFNAQQRSALDALNPTARGDYLDLSNAPGYQAVRDRIQADAATEAAMSASMRGRGGSPYAQGHVASEVADTLAGFDLGQYNVERDRQNSAIGQMFNMG
ncbi:MAG: hypothetical protein KDE63_12675, partial [Novosphingobium sp.]|nr:hypothetical protein [Novosphingobium sp.]